MKKKTLGIAFFLLLALAIAGAVAFKVMGSKKDGDEKKPDVPLVFEPREVTQPLMAVMPITVVFSGPLVAPQTAVVRAKASGSLLSIAVTEGSRVKAGQVLGRMDSSDMDNRVAERMAMVESARAQEAQAQRTYASNQQLADQKFISPIALDASKAALDAARANARAAQAQMGSVRAAVRLANLVAPIDGVVAKRHVVVGEKLSPEQTIVTIVDVRKLELAGSVGTHEVASLKPGMPLQVAMEGVSKPQAGTLLRIAPAAEPGTRSIGVAVAVDNAAETLRAGQYGVASATLAGDVQRLTVPIAATVNSGGQEFVWVLDGDALARRAVTLGLRDNTAGRVEVLQGLTPQTTLLALKFDNLREGQKAHVGSTAKSASEAASAPIAVGSKAAGAAPSAPAK